MAQNHSHKACAQQTFISMERKKILLRVKRYRQHEVKVNWLIVRYWCLATITTIYIGFLVISYILSPISSEANLLTFQNIRRLFPVVLPFYFLANYTIWEKRIVTRTIDAHIQWKKRITTRLT